MRKVLPKKALSLALSVLFLAGLSAAMPQAALAVDVGISAGAPALTMNSHTQTVMFAGQEWWVIGFNGGGVYSQGGAPPRCC